MGRLLRRRISGRELRQCRAQGWLLLLHHHRGVALHP
jgi:hypothetical protein